MQKPPGRPQSPIYSEELANKRGFTPGQYERAVLHDMELARDQSVWEASEQGELIIDAGTEHIDEDYYVVVLSSPNKPCPPEILARQLGIAVLYWGFDGKVHQGAIEVNEAVMRDIEDFFLLAFHERFPLERTLPASHPEFAWDDDKLMEGNVTSGFNYRTIAGTDKPSLHGLGLAFDVNPRQNPYHRLEDGREIVSPPGALWDPMVPGTLHADHVLVQFMESRGWEWGGQWEVPDYQHFQKPLTV